MIHKEEKLSQGNFRFRRLNFHAAMRDRGKVGFAVFLVKNKILFNKASFKNIFEKFKIPANSKQEPITKLLKTKTQSFKIQISLKIEARSVRRQISTPLHFHSLTWLLSTYKRKPNRRDDLF